MGLPAVEYQFRANAEGGSTITGRSRLPFGEMRWREFPFEWLEPEFYRVPRVFESGPFTEARLRMGQREMGGGPEGVFFSAMEPRDVPGGGLTKKGIGA